MSAATATDRSLVAGVATGFAAALRDEGLGVPVTAVAEFARALLMLGDLARPSIYWAGCAVFAASPEDITAYDVAFVSYFEAPTRGSPMGLSFSAVEQQPVRAEDPGPEGDVVDEATLGLAFSDTERLAHADLSTLSQADRAQVLALAARLSQAKRREMTRRYGPSRRARERLDIRRSVARQLRTDGELIDRRYRSRRPRPRRIVVLCDVSGSMAPYAAAMLHLAYALLSGRGRIEVFAMGTRLTRLTRALRHRDLEAALSAAAAEVLDWSGGTRLGETLREFNDHFGVPGAARAASVLVCSDGIDRGDPDLIAAQMARLARITHRIVWANPLKSSPGYQPLARGMAAALPFVDEFLPGDSLVALTAALDRLGL